MAKKKKQDILDDPHMSTQDLIKRTQAVEDEKAEKKRIRLEKKEARERKKHQQKIEKLVAPILLILTIIISFIVKFFGKI